MPPGIGPGRATFDAHYGRDAGLAGDAHEAAGECDCGDSQLRGKQATGVSEQVKRK